MYAKVFAQIFDSSIADDFRLRHFFMDLLVLADQDGIVDMTHTAIAARTRIPLEEVTVMLAKLEQPDPESRTPDADGRRIERLDQHRTWGWHILNYARFRQIASDEQRKASQRERFRRWKGRHLDTANAPLTVTNASNAKQKQKQKQKQEERQPGGDSAHASETAPNAAPESQAQTLAPPAINKPLRQPAPTAPSSIAERIGLDGKRKILLAKLESLRGDTADRWQREANPGAVAERRRVEDEIRDVENRLLAV